MRWDRWKQWQRRQRLECEFAQFILSNFLSVYCLFFFCQFSANNSDWTGWPSSGQGGGWQCLSPLRDETHQLPNTDTDSYGKNHHTNSKHYNHHYFLYSLWEYLAGKSPHFSALFRKLPFFKPLHRTWSVGELGVVEMLLPYLIQTRAKISVSISLNPNMAE